MIRFTFVNAKYLWFFLLLPIIYFLHFYFLRKSKEKALRFANFRVLKRITGKNQITKNNSLLFLRLLIFSLIILGVAGLTATYKGPSNKNDFVIAIDTSSSMTAQDLSPTRLDIAKDIAKNFVDEISGDSSIGLMSFSGVSLIKLLPTTDKNLVKDEISKIDIDKAGGTDISSAIITATNMLLSSVDSGKQLILITDGSNTVETFIDESLQRAVDYSKDHQVTINTIGLGTNTGPVGYLPEYYNIPSSYNKDNLLFLANATGGKYYHAQDSTDLKGIYGTILNDTSERLIKREIGNILLLIGLLALLLEWVLINTRFRKIP